MAYGEEEEDAGGFAKERGKKSKKDIHAEIGKHFEEMMKLCGKLKKSEDEDGEEE